MRGADISPSVTTFSLALEEVLPPLAVTSDPRPFNQQLPEPPDPRCVLEPQDNPEVAPAPVCALCCCFGIIYCCFGEGRAKDLGGHYLRLSPSRMMPTFLLAPEPSHLPARGSYLQCDPCCSGCIPRPMLLLLPASCPSSMPMPSSSHFWHLSFALLLPPT